MSQEQDTNVPCPVVHIHDIDKSEPEMLMDVLNRVRQYQRAGSVDIFVRSRVPMDAPAYKDPGFAEYLVVVKFVDGGKLTVGAIQRQPGAPTEFHS
jgi:hypothetical protein